MLKALSVPSVPAGEKDKAFDAVPKGLAVVGPGRTDALLRWAERWLSAQRCMDGGHQES